MSGTGGEARGGEGRGEERRGKSKGREGTGKGERFKPESLYLPLVALPAPCWYVLVRLSSLATKWRACSHAS